MNKNINKNTMDDDILIGEGIGFERIRRVTGYLAGDIERFNNAKRAEEHDRVKHAGFTSTAAKGGEYNVSSNGAGKYCKPN